MHSHSRREFFRLSSSLALAGGLITTVDQQAYAQQKNWAAEMFETLEHDFRTVGRGTKSEFHFALKNKFEEDVHIASVRTSCGCTTPTIAKQVLKTHETGAIIAKFNTDTFVGKKAATVTVVFDRPYYAEVQLKVAGFIRTDITFDPPEVNFGEVSPGGDSEKDVVITHNGNSNWQITDVRSFCNHLQVSLKPAERSPGIVRYRMKVKLLGSMPEGDIRERITIISNDRAFPTTEMSIAGRVRPTLSISPPTVSVGTTRPGQSVDKRLLIRGETPFAIKEVVCGDDRFSFDVPDGKKKLHFVKMKFNADATDDRVGQEIRIVTDLPKNKSATCIVTGTVVR
ncbi:DUF1573 domain-containing protein [Stieleria marina]|uniref:DUF1573 domain-containing protein n=1 Tax=Stieleria marina TaxID=1930275 RepID=A0A517NV88_9BACT|nr:hypothetical protein K239x_30320 [Planctomycetes bacterium K23_9]